MGMTAAAPYSGEQSEHGRDPLAQPDDLIALSCVMMLERVNYLISIGVTLPAGEMADRLSEIIYAAFRPMQRARTQERAGSEALSVSWW
jgi:hypothetical protein